MNTVFIKEEVKIALKQLKTSSITCIPRAMQIQPIRVYHMVSTRPTDRNMKIIKTTNTHII